MWHSHTHKRHASRVGARVSIQRLVVFGRITTHRNTLKHAATHCNTLQHTATHCNMLQHTATQTQHAEIGGVDTSKYCLCICVLYILVLYVTEETEFLDLVGFGDVASSVKPVVLHYMRSCSCHDVHAMMFIFLTSCMYNKTCINLHHFVWCNDNTWYTIIYNDHTYEWVMSHIWMSHVTHMNESCHNMIIHDTPLSTMMIHATKQITPIQSRSKVPYTPAKEPYICPQKSPMSPTSIRKKAHFLHV